MNPILQQVYGKQKNKCSIMFSVLTGISLALLLCGFTMLCSYQIPDLELPAGDQAVMDKSVVDWGTGIAIAGGGAGLGATILAIPKFSCREDGHVARLSHRKQLLALWAFFYIILIGGLVGSAVHVYVVNAEVHSVAPMLAIISCVLTVALSFGLIGWKQTRNRDTAITEADKLLKNNDLSGAFNRLKREFGQDKGKKIYKDIFAQCAADTNLPEASAPQQGEMSLSLAQQNPSPPTAPPAEFISNDTSASKKLKGTLAPGGITNNCTSACTSACTAGNLCEIPEKGSQKESGPMIQIDPNTSNEENSTEDSVLSVDLVDPSGALKYDITGEPTYESFIHKLDEIQHRVPRGIPKPAREVADLLKKKRSEHSRGHPHRLEKEDRRRCRAEEKRRRRAWNYHQRLVDEKLHNLRDKLRKTSGDHSDLMDSKYKRRSSKGKRSSRSKGKRSSSSKADSQTQPLGGKPAQWTRV